MLYYALLIFTDILFGSQFMVINGYQKKNGNTIRSSLALSVFEGIFVSVIFFIASGFKIHFTSFSVICSLLLAIIFMLCSIVGIKTLSLGNVAIYTLFIMSGGMVVPFLVGVFYLNEEVSVFKVVGIVLIISMLLLPTIIKSKETINRTKKETVLFYCFALLLFLTNGLNSVIIKIHQINVNAIESSSFISLYFLFLAIFSLFFYVIFSIIEKTKKNKIDSNDNSEKTYTKLLNKNAILFGFIYALINGGANFLNTIVAKEIDATIQFPIITGGTILVSIILGRIIFKEKLNKIQIVQLITVTIAIILFVL